MSSINNSVDDDHHALRRQHPRDLDPGSDYLPTPQPQPRRPRGFAATAAAATTGPSAGAKGKKEREKEKERTKLRERHRRAITSRMLAGLRQYGNFPLPARADMNDVLAALAREAGWIVDTDGSTYRQSPPPSHLVCVTNFGLVFSFFLLRFFFGSASLVACLVAEKMEKSSKFLNSFSYGKMLSGGSKFSALKSCCNHHLVIRNR
jgi:hypothetical protein